MAKEMNNIVIEGADIRFRNFSGKEGKFNPAGRRNFCVLLDTEMAHDLEDKGWNIKWLQPREEGDDPQAYIQVSIRYGDYPPKIVLVSGRGKTVLDEESIGMLDWAELTNVDVVLRPYTWDVSGRTGVKAYLKTMYATIYEDEFESKYYDTPDTALSSM